MLFLRANVGHEMFIVFTMLPCYSLFGLTTPENMDAISNIKSTVKQQTRTNSTLKEIQIVENNIKPFS